MQKKKILEGDWLNLLSYLKWTNQISFYCQVSQVAGGTTLARDEQ